MKHVFLIALLLSIAVSTAAETIAIVGAKVHTVGPQGALDDATVVIEDGRIAAVGRNVNVPRGARRIDAAGKLLTPGFFSPVGRLGLVEVGFSAGPLDYTQRGATFSAGFDVSSAFNPRSTLVAVNRIEGVTTAVTMPSAGGMDEMGNAGSILPGLASVVQLSDDNWLLKSRAAMLVKLGESGSGFSGGSRAGAFLQLKNALDEAADYRDHKRDVERGMRREYSLSLVDLEALQAVLNRSIPLLVEAHRASDIEAIIDLADTYRLRLVLYGATEAWMIAGKVAAAKVPVIVSVTDNLPGNFDQLNARRGLATALISAGVAVALTDGQSETHNARNLTQSAGNAVADGLNWNAALRAITLAPAQMFGVADEVGSIEVGKRADLVIWPDDPFELSTYAEQVFIGGKAVPMQSRQTLLRDRYLNYDGSLPPAYQR